MKNISLDDRLLLTGSKFLESKNHWIRHLESIDLGNAASFISKDHKSAGFQHGHCRLDLQTSTMLIGICKKKEIATFTYICAALSILIQKYCNNPNILLGSPLFRRDNSAFIEPYNTVLPLAVNLNNSSSFRELLSNVGDVVLSAYRHQDYPLTHIYELLNNVSPISYDIIISFNNLHLNVHEGTSNIPLIIDISFYNGFINLDAKSSVVLPFSINHFLYQFSRVISWSLSDIDAPLNTVPLKMNPEMITMFTDFSGTNVSVAKSYLLGAEISATGLFSSDAVVLSFEDRSLSGFDLGVLISGCIHYLRDILGLSSGDRVVVLVPRSEWTVVMFLSVLQSGLVYVPVDVDYPLERIRFILSDVCPSLVVADDCFTDIIREWGYSQALLSDLFGAKGALFSNQPIVSAPGDEAYIIYTSGSTGYPKGVMVTHGSLSSFAHHIQSAYAFTGLVRMPLLASSSFDISIFQMLLPLLHGGECIVVSKESVQDMRQLSEILKAVTVLDTVPGVYGQLVRYIEENRSWALYDMVDKLFIGGDLIGDELLKRLSTVFCNADLVVTYGPTETTIFCTSVEYERGFSLVKGSVLGRPIVGAEIYVLDDNMDPVPIGVEGEICIGGSGVSLGYLNLPLLTASRFVNNPYGDSGSLLYRSGDRGRWTQSGMLEFRGRLDEQLKIRGYRIEPGEIEQVMLGHERINQVVVQSEIGDDELAILRGYYVEKPAIQLWPSISEYLGYNEIAYYAMNNDEQRAGSYRSAIAAKVKGKVVVDVGTGPEAILAQHCILSGAKRVYAIEILEDVYIRAKEKVASLGLSEQIIVLLGDVQDVELPEQVDYCVCALVGNLGSSDGCIPIMNSARRYLKNSENMIPCRSISYIAAVDLESSSLSYDLTETGAYYLHNIFEQQGGRFDIRMCVQGISESDLLSGTAVFEELDLKQYLPLSANSQIEMQVLRKGVMSGFVIWLQLHTSEGIVNDIMQSQQSFLPVYFPVFEYGVEVEPGDMIIGTVWRTAVTGTVYPDYTIQGRLVNKDKVDKEFSYTSKRLPEQYRGSHFYKKFFSGDSFLIREPLTSSSLRIFMEKYLPDYMVPGMLLKVESIPLTANGKINRKLLQQQATQSLLEKNYIAPVGEIARQLAQIWESLLGITGIGMKDNFFDLGGHSLLATRVVSAIRGTMSQDLSIRDVFKYVTLESLSIYLESLSTVPEPALTAFTNKPDLIPLSFGQERLWFIDRLEGSIQYHIPAVLRMQGELDQVGLEYSFQQIVNRHEVLRTVIKEINGEAFQSIILADNWQLGLLDLSQENTLDEDSINELINKLVSTPFDLSQDYKLRADLITLSKTDFLLVITLHHIASDGWSMPIMTSELVEFYQHYKLNTEVNLPVLSLQYSDYAIWQRSVMQGKLLQTGLTYWKNKLKGVCPLELPTDYKRSQLQSSRKGGLYRFRIDHDLQSKLQQLSKQEGVTMFMTLLTCFKVLLYRYSGQTDICVGSAIAGRQRQELEGMIGFFVNTLPLRSNLEGNPTFRELLQSVRETTLQAYEYQDVPFEKIVDAVVDERIINTSPLFQVMFDLQNNKTDSDTNIENFYISNRIINNSLAKYDLTCTIEEHKTDVWLQIEYASDIYVKSTIQRMVQQYVEILESVVLSPGNNIYNLNILPESEYFAITETFIATTQDFSKDQTIVSLLESRVRISSDFPAIISEDGITGFYNFDLRSNQLGHYLVGIGIKPNDVVAVFLDRSEEMLIGIYGILKSGGCYLPIDIEYPQERILYMLENSNSVLVLTTSHLSPILSGIPGLRILSVDIEKAQVDMMPSFSVNALLSPSDLAYIIYTSGSTGQPKGVMVSHRNAINYLKNSQTEYLDKSSTGSGSYIHLSCAFDASITALFMPLLEGRSVVISKRTGYEVFSDPLFLQHAPYDFIKLTPAHLDLLNSSVPYIDQSLTKCLVVGGAALHANQIKHYVLNGIKIINEYGPTESTVGCSTYRLNSWNPILDLEGAIPIGKPIDNVYFYILDAHGGLCPIGVNGELHVGGESVSLGYLNAKDLTALKFIDNPIEGGKGKLLYCTGDICRWDSSGNLLFEGRRDDQVKIRGHRVVLSDIERQVLSSGLVKQCVPVLQKTDSGTDKLVCYIVWNGLSNQKELEKNLQSSLPEYMLPNQIISLEMIPLTSNGKLDQKSLKSITTPYIDDDYILPRTELEATIATIWKDLLGVEQVSINDNFFQLGGDSILAVKLVSYIRKQLDVQVSISTLFDFPTVLLLTDFIRKTGTNSLKEYKFVRL